MSVKTFEEWASPGFRAQQGEQGEQGRAQTPAGARGSLLARVGWCRAVPLSGVYMGSVVCRVRVLWLFPSYYPGRICR